MKTDTELLDQFRADNLRLVAENLRLRSQRQKIKTAFARSVNAAFVKSKHCVDVLDYRCREVIPAPQVTDEMQRAV